MSTTDTFFREYAMRIGSSRSIKTALTNACEYLKDFLPLDEAVVMVGDETLQGLRCLCRVAVGGVTALHAEIVPFPSHIWANIHVRAKTLRPFIGGTIRERWLHEMEAVSGLERLSYLMVPLLFDNELIATLSVVADGPDLFTQSHLDLLANVARPTAIAISNALAHEELLRYHALFMDENRFLKSDTFEVAIGNIIGADRGMRQVVEMVKQVAPLNNTVLLLGETGTGKELIANAIHFSSTRSDGPFIKVNCGAIPESLIDSELFGYEKGAFTGATGMRAGYFERADHGTIFLDEIGELPLQAQVRLLRILQTREVQRIGGARSIPVDIRIIAATHRNLESMVSQRTFREDLWFRINTFPLTIPPLRQRQEDIPALTRHFVERKSLEMRLGTPPQIAPDVLKRLIEYHWPGNVRELENIVERELIRYRGGLLSFDTLVPSRMGEALILEEKAPLPPSCTKLDDATRAHIQWVLGMAGGKIHGPGGAAELLGIKPTTLRDRMDKLGITFRRQA